MTLYFSKKALMVSVLVQILFIFMCIVPLYALAFEQSMPGTSTRQQQQPLIQVSPMPVGKPDLIITMGGHGSVYAINKLLNIEQYAMNVEFTIKNIGNVATGPAGSTFSVGAGYIPLCQAPNCQEQVHQDIPINAISCAIHVRDSTRSFSFSPPIIISPPLAAGESRTIMGLLVLPQCLQWSTLGRTASVHFIVDDKNQVNESKEYNNKSTILTVTSPGATY